MRANSRTTLPDDVRAMNAAFWVVMGLVFCLLLALSANWAMHQPRFALRGVRLEGDLARNSEPTIRANAMPRLSGNFLTMDLAQARRAFESIPWVRHAVVRRVWPGWLVVRLQEHWPAALWLEDDGNQRMVNSQGEVFDADVDDLREEDLNLLPVFSGRPSAAPLILAMYGRLNAALRPLGHRVTQLSLSDRGLWELELDDGREMVLGRGADEEVLSRVGLFVRSISSVEAKRQASWARVDLRHPQGYAVSWREKTPVRSADSPNKTKN